jgi:small subunit ribosomal protein S21
MLIIECKGKKIEWVLKKYRQRVDSTGQLDELRQRKEFEKSSAKKRKLKQRAQYKSKNNDAKI